MVMGGEKQYWAFSFLDVADFEKPGNLFPYTPYVDQMTIALHTNLLIRSTLVYFPAHDRPSIHRLFRAVWPRNMTVILQINAIRLYHPSERPAVPARATLFISLWRPVGACRDLFGCVTQRTMATLCI